jgi:hypothetical protein
MPQRKQAKAGSRRAETIHLDDGNAAAEDDFGEEDEDQLAYGQCGASDEDDEDDDNDEDDEDNDKDEGL